MIINITNMVLIWRMTDTVSNKTISKQNIQSNAIKTKINDSKILLVEELSNCVYALPVQCWQD